MKVPILTYPLSGIALGTFVSLNYAQHVCVLVPFGWFLGLCP